MRRKQHSCCISRRRSISLNRCLLFCVIFFSYVLFFPCALSSIHQEARWMTPPNSSEIAAFSSEEYSPTTRRTPLVFIYTVSSECPKYFPEYIKTSLFQAIRSQPHLDVILLSNFKDCDIIFESVRHTPSLYLVDCSLISSPATQRYDNLSKEFFRVEINNFLWRASALRFFYLQDFMQKFAYHEALHIEADNLLYHPFTENVLRILREHYPLAITALYANKSSLTASVFWVARLHFLREFTHYLSMIVLRKEPVWSNYLRFLRKWFCCRPGGFEPDPSTGLGIKPYGINEMSMLGYYHTIHKEILMGLPLLPSYPDFPRRKPFIDLRGYVAGGSEVGPATSIAVWDSGSYGQYIGGTWLKRGRDVGFVDLSHVIGQAIALAACEVQILCTRNGSQVEEISPQELERLKGVALPSMRLYDTCYTAPFVRCQKDELRGAAVWVPLWNLHVHSKYTDKFASRPCDCKLLSS